MGNLGELAHSADRSDTDGGKTAHLSDARRVEQQACGLVLPRAHCTISYGAQPCDLSQRSHCAIFRIDQPVVSDSVSGETRCVGVEAGLELALRKCPHVPSLQHPAREGPQWIRSSDEQMMATPAPSITAMLSKPIWSQSKTAQSTSVMLSTSPILYLGPCTSLLPGEACPGVRRCIQIAPTSRDSVRADAYPSRR